MELKRVESLVSINFPLLWSCAHTALHFVSRRRKLKNIFLERVRRNKLKCETVEEEKKVNEIRQLVTP
jgi:hypothetical protein